MLKDFINNYFNDDDIFSINTIDRTEKDKKKNFKTYMNTKKSVRYDLLKKFNYYNKDIYISLNTFNKYRQENDVKTFNKIFFDIDENGEEIKDKIINIFGKPNLLIQTSKEKYQLIYILKIEKETKEDIKRLSYNLTNYFKTDHTFDLARIYRLPFFINNKNGFQVELLENNFTKRFSFNEFIQFFKDKKYYELQEKKEQTTKTTRNKTTTAPELKTIELKSEYINFYNTFLKITKQDRSAADYIFMKKYKDKKEIINILKNIHLKKMYDLKSESYYIRTYNKII